MSLQNNARILESHLMVDPVGHHCQSIHFLQDKAENPKLGKDITNVLIVSAGS